MMELAVAFVAVFALPTALYFVGIRSGDVWGLVRKGQIKAGRGLYRATPMIVWEQGEAPPSVRVAAFTSFLLGQMIIPGAPAAFVGFVVLCATLANEQLNLALIALVASAPTGLFVAGRLLAVGTELLQHQPDAAAKARRAARWEIGHNGALLLGLGLAALSGNEKDQIGCALGAVPAMVAIAHGLLLRRAAATLEAYDAEQQDADGLGSHEGLAPGAALTEHRR
jgi:hypothetical protein